MVWPLITGEPVFWWLNIYLREESQRAKEFGIFIVKIGYSWQQSTVTDGGVKGMYPAPHIHEHLATAYWHEQPGAHCEQWHGHHKAHWRVQCAVLSTTRTVCWCTVVTYRTCGSRSRPVCHSMSSMHAHLCDVSWVVSPHPSFYFLVLCDVSWVVSPHPSFYFLVLFLFQLYLMSIPAPDEISIEDPLCNSSLGSMVTLDYVTHLTFWAYRRLKQSIQTRSRRLLCLYILGSWTGQVQAIVAVLMTNLADSKTGRNLSRACETESSCPETILWSVFPSMKTSPVAKMMWWDEMRTLPTMVYYTQPNHRTPVTIKNRRHKSQLGPRWPLFHQKKTWSRQSVKWIALQEPARATVTPRGKTKTEEESKSKAETQSSWHAIDPRSHWMQNSQATRWTRRIQMGVLRSGLSTCETEPSPCHLKRPQTFLVRLSSTCQHDLAVFSSFCATLTPWSKHMAPQQGVRSDASHGDISLDKLESNTESKRFNIKFLEDVVVGSKETPIWQHDFAGLEEGRASGRSS